MDRAYVDFQRLFRLHAAAAFFVVRAKSNTRWWRRYSRPVDKQQGLRCNQTIVLTGRATASKYSHPLRRVGFRDTDLRRTFHLLTNNFELPARTVADLYRHRWHVELFFRWLKQHLRIQTFLGTSENAVKAQIWIAVSVYVLIAILKKRLDLPGDLYAIRQVLSLTPFEPVPPYPLLASPGPAAEPEVGGDQLSLFDV